MELYPTRCKERGCRYWIRAGGDCPDAGRHEMAKSWRTPAWKERSRVVISRTEMCETCDAPFSKENPASVNHIVVPTKPDGVIDLEAYVAMRDGEVEVICRRCHFVWTKYKKRLGDPEITCPACKGLKKPERRLCFSCWGGERRVDEIRRFNAGAAAAEAALREASSRCTHHCDSVSLVSLDHEGSPDVFGYTIPECIADEFVSDHRDRFRLWNDELEVDLITQQAAAFSQPKLGRPPPWKQAEAAETDRRHGYLDRALRKLDDAISRTRTEPELYLVERAFLRIESRDWNCALGDLDRVLELDASHVAARFLRAFALLQSAQRSEAIKEFCRSLDLDPSCSIAYYFRGVALHENGNHREALENFRRAIDLAPKNWELRDDAVHHITGLRKTTDPG